MNMTPKLLGVFTQIYGSNDAMDFGKAALVAVVGFVTVIVILAIIALFIKAIAAIFDKTSKTAQAPVDPANVTTYFIYLSGERDRCSLRRHDQAAPCFKGIDC